MVLLNTFFIPSFNLLRINIQSTIFHLTMIIYAVARGIITENCMEVKLYVLF